MLLEFDSSVASVMGVSNSELFLPEKDLKVAMEFKLIRSNAEDPDRLLRHNYHHQQQHKEAEEEEEEDKSPKIITSMVSSSLIEVKKLPSLGDFSACDDGDDEGFKTPPSFDHKIPMIQRQCPPPPRKPKSTKRKLLPRRRIALDLSEEEFYSLFPPSPTTAAVTALLSDLYGNRQVKKSRKGKNDDKD